MKLYGDDFRAANKIYTYFVVDTQHWLVKVGESRRPVLRFRQLCRDIQPTSRHRWLILWGIEDSTRLSERKIHSLWSAARRDHPVFHCGRSEWFDMADDLVRLCLSMMSAGRAVGADESTAVDAFVGEL